MISTPWPSLVRQAPAVVLVALASVWVGAQVDRLVPASAELTRPFATAASAQEPQWCDVPVHQGLAEIALSAADTASDTVLIVSAFGTPRQITAVDVELTTELPTRTSATVTWQRPTSPPVPVRDAPGFPVPVIDVPADEPATGQVIARRVTYRGESSGRRSGVRSRTLFLPRPGRDGHSAADYDPLECVPAASGRRCQVWRDLQTPWDARLERWADQVVGLLERTLLPAVEGSQGRIDDLDGSGGVTIVVTNRVASYSSTTPALCAFVRPSDFRRDLDRPWSNHADLVYLQPGVSDADLTPILAHELTHLAQLSWCSRTFGTEPWPLPDWLAEGVAHASEVQLTGQWQNVTDRLDAFRREPHRCPLLVDDALSAGLWRDPGSRGAACAFGLWCAERYGPRWWTQWLRGHADDGDRWELVGGEPFTDVYRAWTLSLATDGVPSPSSAQPALAESPLVADAEAAVLSLQGTASAYLRLEADAPTVLRIAAPADCRVQVTLVRRP
jgi:hypothetical protein